MDNDGFNKWWELVSLDGETTKDHAREYYQLAVTPLEEKLRVAEGEWKTYAKVSEQLSEKLGIAVKALEFYGNRMGSGGTARSAILKIKAK